LSVTVVPSWRFVESWGFVINKTESSWTLPVVAAIIGATVIFAVALMFFYVKKARQLNEKHDL